MTPKITTLLIIILVVTSFSNYSTAQGSSLQSKIGVSSTITPTAIKDTTKTNTPDIAMVFVQGGSFKMGSETIDGASKPHQVTLSNFYIGKYEVTQAQWLAVMGTNPASQPNCRDCPIENVSYDDVQTYIGKLNKLTGKTYRLPTEAEWEYAARGGNKTNNYTYSGSNNIDDVGWYMDNADFITHPVGRKLANELAINDMTGNVMEWCQDWYNADYYANSPVQNPQGPSTGTERVIRGGYFIFDANQCLVANRHSYPPIHAHVSIGLRLVLVR